MVATLLAAAIWDAAQGAILLEGLMGVGAVASGIQAFLSQLIQNKPHNMVALNAAFTFGTFNVLSLLGKFFPSKSTVQIGVGTAVNVVVNMLIEGGKYVLSEG